MRLLWGGCFGEDGGVKFFSKFFSSQSAGNAKCLTSSKFMEGLKGKLEGGFSTYCKFSCGGMKHSSTTVTFSVIFGAAQNTIKRKCFSWLNNFYFSSVEKKLFSGDNV